MSKEVQDERKQTRKTTSEITENKRLRISAKLWILAEAFCESFGGHLVTITSQGEQDFMESITDASLWIGAYLDEESGEWKWVTDEAWSYENWGEGEPSGNGEAYGCIWPQLWNDLSESSWEQSGFICEWD